MSNAPILDSVEPAPSLQPDIPHRNLGLTAGETAHLARAAATVLTGLSNRQLRLSSECFFSFFEARHELLGLLAADVAQPEERQTAYARLRAIGCQLAQIGNNLEPTPLDRRLGWIVKSLSLDEEETAILGVMARTAMFASWRELTQVPPFKVTNPSCELLALVTGLPIANIDQRLEPGAPLLSSGLIIDENDGEYCASRLLLRIARYQTEDHNVLARRMMPPAPPSTLIWEDFCHLGPLRDLTERVVGSGEPVSILLHGRPGTGKTEFARLLADRLNRSAVFAGLTDEQGGEPSRRERLAHLTLLRALSKENRGALVIVDEADDVLRIVDHRDQQAGSKQWLNRLVEEPQTPTIWILNDPEQIDPALVRRMTLAISFETPPPIVRSRIVARAAQTQGLTFTERDLNALAALEAEPAIVTAGVRVARLSTGGSDEACLSVNGVLKALGRRRPVSPLADACYDPALASADCDLSDLAERLVSKRARRWSLLLAGPSGTGKSAFARYIAARLELDIEERRASDLLDSYVGQTERRIADAFACAGERGAMLLIDEADSFLFRREAGQRTWETGMVNEMLRWMEHLRAPFVATTNLSNRLDPAIQRRFTMRVNFMPMSPTQACTLFSARFGLEPPASLQSVYNLTPGDFSVVSQRAKMLGEDRPLVLAEWLHQEATLRGDGHGPIGFHVPTKSH